MTTERDVTDYICHNCEAGGCAQYDALTVPLLKDVAFYKGALESSQTENRRYRQEQGMAYDVFNQIEAEGGHGSKVHGLIRAWRQALTEPEKGEV